MIDIEHVWAPQIFWYCDLIADRTKLISAFNQGDEKIWTSVVSYDELICQIFDDLRSLDQISILKSSRLPPDLRVAIEKFVLALNAFDEGRKIFFESDLETIAWHAVERTATDALVAAKIWKADAQTH